MAGHNHVFRLGEIDFEWDEDKAASNLRKHGASFQEAASVFLDPLAETFYDRAHSQGEHREVTIGMSARGRLLVVWTTERTGRVRIIGAREPSPRERRHYQA